MLRQITCRFPLSPRSDEVRGGRRSDNYRDSIEETPYLSYRRFSRETVAEVVSISGKTGDG